MDPVHHSRVSQQASQPNSQSVRQSVYQPASEADSQPDSQSVNQSGEGGVHPASPRTARCAAYGERFVEGAGVEGLGGRFQGAGFRN